MTRKILGKKRALESTDLADVHTALEDIYESMEQLHLADASLFAAKDPKRARIISRLAKANARYNKATCMIFDVCEELLDLLTDLERLEYEDSEGIPVRGRA